MLIVFEGIDGCGKTTQINKIKQATEAEFGITPLVVREPGGTQLGNELRHIVLNAHYYATTIAQSFVFAAARAQLTETIILPHLREGGIVLADRYSDSTLAYQGYGHGLPMKTLRAMIDLATLGVSPSLSIYFNLDPAIAMSRKKAKLDAGDQHSLEFYTRVANGYEALVRQSPAQWATIDASKKEDEVFNQIMDAIRPLLES